MDETLKGRSSSRSCGHILPKRTLGRRQKPISIKYRAEMKTPMTKLGGERNPLTALNKNCYRK
jgi:hypothetical protein